VVVPVLVVVVRVDVAPTVVLSQTQEHLKSREQSLLPNPVHVEEAAMPSVNATQDPVRGKTVVVGRGG
jgi:hypothetical protein